MQIGDYGYYTVIAYYINNEHGIRGRGLGINTIGFYGIPADAVVKSHIANKHDLKNITDVSRWTFRHGNIHKAQVAIDLDKA